jgi:hypothetical protein
MKEFFSSKVGRALLCVASVVGATVGMASMAGASVISSAYTTAQTSLTTQFGEGALVVVALLVLGIGIRLLVKLVHRAISAA